MRKAQEGSQISHEEAVCDYSQSGSASLTGNVVVLEESGSLGRAGEKNSLLPLQQVNSPAPQHLAQGTEQIPCVSFVPGTSHFYFFLICRDRKLALVPPSSFGWSLNPDLRSNQPMQWFVLSDHRTFPHFHLIPFSSLFPSTQMTPPQQETASSAALGHGDGFLKEQTLDCSE